jgi:predicted YcjX-like family ATPase
MLSPQQEATLFSSLTDGIARQISDTGNQVAGIFSEPKLRLGVTGLSRAGKTVFITSLIANLLDRGRMGQLRGADRIEAVYLQPQPDDTLPRFAYEDHLAAITANSPHWPQSTRAISELRLSFRLSPRGLLGGLTGPRILHVDLVDYPGEWLLDLALLDQSYATWAEDTLTRLAKRPEAAAYLALARAEDGSLPLSEPRATALAASFSDYLHQAKAAGWSDCTPGRFLLPGDLAGSPALTFAPLPATDAPRGSLSREMQRRYDAYVAQVVKPFFRDHFAKIDRQIVLVDVLGAVHAGPPALEDLRRTMAAVLSAFRPGRSRFLSQIFGGKRVEKILFAATKADYLHHSQHPALTAITESLLRDAITRADFAGAETKALSMAALRCTVEENLSRDGVALPAVRGRQMDTGKQVALYAGALPSDPARLISPARQGAEKWLDQDFGLMQFAPAKITLAAGFGPPHIRLDRAAEFLIGDMF